MKTHVLSSISRLMCSFLGRGLCISLLSNEFEALKLKGHISHSALASLPSLIFYTTLHF